MRLLIAEDDTKLLKSLIHLFRKNNFSVDGVSNGMAALEHGMTGKYDAMILDIMMPEMDGIEVLQQLRANEISTPVLFLTARTETEQKIDGLDAGADDYLSKPFSAGELLARTRAMLRRKDNYTPEIMEFKGMTLNRSTYQLKYEDHVILLKGKEYQLMEMLMLRPEMMISIEDIITYIWGWDAKIDSNTVWVHMSNLRKKLKDRNFPITIKFIRGAGYILYVQQDQIGV